MKTFIYAIRDGEGYWFQHFADGEVFFASPPETAKQYDNAAKALTERDALGQMLGDDSLTVRQVGPTAGKTIIVSRGEGGDEHLINWGEPENQP
jgi:hypothetical protein